MKPPTRTPKPEVFAAACLSALICLSGCTQTPSTQTPQAQQTRNGGSNPQAGVDDPAGGDANGAGDFADVNLAHPGESIDMAAALSGGKFTIVEFWSPYCPPCLQLRPMLRRLAMQRRDLAIRAVNINRPQVMHIDFRSPVAIQFGLQILPSFQIYGPDKSLQASGVDAYRIVADCLQANPRWHTPSAQAR